MNAGEFSEKDLLRSCINGDKKAWDQFVEKYTDLVYHAIHKTVRRYCADFLYHDLEDIHNSIFLSLIEDDYRKLKQYQGLNGCTMASWLVVVVSNATVNFIKGDKTLNSLDDPLGEDKTLKDVLPDLTPSVLDRIEKSEQAALLNELLEGLNANDRLFLKYYYEEELPPDEIAGIMNLTVSAIYSKKNRILEKLKKIAKKKKIVQENQDKSVF